MEHEMADETTDTTTTTETTAPAEPEVPATATAPGATAPEAPAEAPEPAAEPEPEASTADTPAETPAAPETPTAPAQDVPDVTPDGTKQWALAALVRAGKTAAQAAVAAIGTASIMGDVDWRVVASTALLAAVLSLLTSVAGVPEVAGSASVAQIRKAAK